MPTKTGADPALEELARQFDQHCPHLLRIAQRTLGSFWGAEDAVQEAWLRLQRADAGHIDNLQAWLTTVVSRVCIDAIRQEQSRREDLVVEVDVSDGIDVDWDADLDAADHEVMQADSINIALSVVLGTLGPLERLTLVLHDVFGLPFDDIAPIVERSSVAARQLASRARARLRGVDVAMVREQHHGALDVFLSAARSGNFGGLLQLLDPEVELRADAAAVALATEGAAHGAPLLTERVQGADAVARVFAGRAFLVRVVLLAGLPSGLFATDGVPQAVYLVHIEEGRIRALEVVGNPAALKALGARCELTNASTDASTLSPGDALTGLGVASPIAECFQSHHGLS